jgi:tripartite-type tricarboxylate transporter receptor subunit TctC
MMSHRSPRPAALLSGLVMSALAMTALAQFAHAQTYPAKPVKLIVPFGPGGSVDAVARKLASDVGADWGQQILVENKPGAQADLGSAIVAQSDPDGYTLLLTSQAVAVNASLRPKRAYKVDDLQPIMLVARTQAVMLVPAALPAKTVKEFIALAKAQPGKLDYGSTGVGTSGHMAVELFRIATGIDIVHVPYKNIGQNMTDAIAGRTKMIMATIPAAIPHINAGRLRALGVTGPKRSTGLPDVPTVAEAGVPGYEATTWYGMFARKGTPAAVVGRINTAFKTSIAKPEVSEWLVKRGVEPVASTPAECATMVNSEVERWAKVVKEAKIGTQ